MVMPGDNVEMLCDIYNPIALENGQRFNIREGGRTVSYSPDVFRREHLKSLESCASVILPSPYMFLDTCHVYLMLILNAR